MKLSGRIIEQQQDHVVVFQPWARSRHMVMVLLNHSHLCSREKPHSLWVQGAVLCSPVHITIPVIYSIYKGHMTICTSKIKAASCIGNTSRRWEESLMAVASESSAWEGCVVPSSRLGTSAGWEEIKPNYCSPTWNSNGGVMAGISPIQATAY